MNLGSGHGCYFKKQPETPEEIEQACRAAWASCCDQVRYVGNDPEIKQRIREVAAAGYIRKPLSIREWLVIAFFVVAGLLVIGSLVCVLRDLVR